VSEHEPLADDLSNREMEVAQAYAVGQSYKEIARDLGISPTTIRSHLRTVYGKLAVTSKIELARFLGGTSAPEEARDSIAIAAELALELDDAIRRERSMARVLRIISDQDGELEPVIDGLLVHALEICEAEFGILFEYLGDMRFRELRSCNIAPVFAQWLAEAGDFEVEPGTGIGRVAAQLQMINIADVRGEDIYQNGSPLRIATADLGKARSFAAIPMTSGTRLIGVFTVYRTRVHPFNDRALELVQLFPDQAAIAIENVRQFQERQARLERETVTRKILQVVGDSRHDEQPVFDAILENTCRLCEANMGAFVMGRAGDAAQVMVAHNGATEATIALYRDGHYTMEPGDRTLPTLSCSAGPITSKTWPRLIATSRESRGFGLSLMSRAFEPFSMCP
jgi:DNA-binding CsgD family transcriptional regulator